MPSAPQSPTTQASPAELFPASQTPPNQYGIPADNDLPHHPIFGGGDGSASPPQGRETTSGTSSPDARSEEADGNEEFGSNTGGQVLSSHHSPESKGKSVHRKYRRPDANGAIYVNKLPNEVLTHTLSFLDPTSLTSVSLVNRRFHALVTSPHAWKDAFSRYFPQHNARHPPDNAYPTSARYFTRLSPLGTHRTEYILRTQLLRSLKRGRPHILPAVKPSASRENSSNFSMITYNPKLHESTITHLSADFARNRVIAASQYTGLYSYSDPRTGYVEVEQRLHPGYSSLGLTYISQDGIGAMDLSESRGQIIGDGREGFPSFFVERATGTAAPLRFVSDHGPDASITCVWLAKKDTIVNTSGGSIVSASGSSKGIVQFQGPGSGWMTFCVCPGIPILDIRVDDGYTKARERRNRVWCVIVNALGEVWYMKGKLPKTMLQVHRNMGEQPPTEFTAWYCIPSTRKPGSPVGYGIEKEETAAPSMDTIKYMNTWLQSSAELMAIRFSDDWRMDYLLEADFGYQNFLVGCKGVEESTNGIRRRAELAQYSRILDNVREELISEVFVKNVYGRGFHKEIEDLVPQPAGDSETPDDWSLTVFQIPRNTGKDWTQITASAIDMSNIALLAYNEDPAGNRSSRAPYAKQPTVLQIPGQQSRLFAIGTSTGSVHIYNARSFSSSTPLPPLHTIETESPSISSLALSSLYLVHGGADGLVQAWDPLVSVVEPIRAIHSRFSTRARRRLIQAASSVHGIGENQFAARAIYLDPDPTVLRGIVALGTHVRSWSFLSSVGKVESNSNARRRKNAARRGSQGAASGAATGKGRSKSGIKGDILDEVGRVEGMKREHEKREQVMMNRFGVERGGMTEEEMVMYAMMISEETFEKDRGLASPTAGFETFASGGSNGEGFGEDVWLVSEGSSPGSGQSHLGSLSEGWYEGDDDRNQVYQVGEGSGSVLPTVEDDPLEGLASTPNEEEDLALAQALQESFILESQEQANGVRIPASPPLIDIPIKFAKNKKRKSAGVSVSASPTVSRGSPFAGTSGVTSPKAKDTRRNSGRQEEDDQFDRDLELAIQLSLKE